jgi:hypothetical protein
MANRLAGQHRGEAIVPDHILESGDSPDLEALFDSIASQQKKLNLSSPHRQLRQAALPALL